ncbi:MAG: carboxypeptidase-like regulatory domain-containing protein, partial [Thermoanaerobaculia bacterium]
MNTLKPARFLILLCLLVLLPVVSFAQSSNGSISGNVTDASGGALPGVSVTASNIATHATRVAISNGSGHYDLLLLPPGTYSVSGELAGFQAVRYERIVVNVGTGTGLNLRMAPGVTDVLTVTASAPLVETTRSEVSSVVNDKAIQNLPVNGRNFLDFVLTTPGVVRDPRGGDISFAGQKGTLNSVIVDGADN